MKYQELIRTIEEKHIQDYCSCDLHGEDPQWGCLGCAEDGLDVVFPCDAIKFADSLAATLANEKFWAGKRQEVLRKYGYETTCNHRGFAHFNDWYVESLIEQGHFVFCPTCGEKLDTGTRP